MKLALGIMFYNELPWLKLHLPSMLDAVDGVVAVDSHSTDGSTEYVQSLGIQVWQFEWHWHWADQFNHVIDVAESTGYDALLRLDPDECMFPADISSVRALLADYKLLLLPRYNFWRTRLHYVPLTYPDWQARAWQLNQGTRLSGRQHETINWRACGWSTGVWDRKQDTREVMIVPTANLYHYGDLVNPALRYMNLDRVLNHQQPPLANFPDHVEPAYRHSIPFEADQPLDPFSVGLFAPFTEEHFSWQRA